MIKKYLKYIFLFILIEFIIIASLNYSNVVRKEVILNKQLSMLNIQYHTTFNNYKELAECFFNSSINKENIISLFKSAYLNKNSRDELRDKLFNLLNSDYEKLKKFGVAQLHFHFKDGISFLRFHRATKYGDFLFPFRKSLEIVNKQKRYLDGFEVGKHYGSYRFIFPVYDSSNEHFGSVEVSLPSILFMSKMNLTYPSHIHFMIKKDILDKKVVKYEQKYFEACDLSENYIFEKEEQIDKLGISYDSLHEYVDKHIIVKLDLAIKDEVVEKLELFEAFAISKYIDSECYIVSFLPVKNMDGESVAYIVSYLKSAELLEVKVTSLIQLIIYTLFNLMLMIFIYKTSKTKELRELKERFEIIFNNANDGILLVDIKTKKFLMSNKKIEEMLGFSEEEMRKLTVFDIHPKSEYERIESDFIKLINNEKVNAIDILVKRKDGKLFYADVTASSKLKIANVDYVVKIFRDITERKNFEDKLQTLNMSLEKRVAKEVLKNREKDRVMFEQSKLAQMGEMLSMIAHQWRQPINAISAASINMSVRQQLDELSGDFVEEQTDFIQKEAQKMSSVIDEFMNFFKSDSNEIKFKLVDSIEEVFNLMSAQLNNRSIKYSYEVDKDLEIVGCKSDLEHVLINILSNARDAFSNQKESNLKVIKLKVIEMDEVINIEIEDNAGGIEESIRDKIFNPYFSTKEEGKGLGMGLYISKNIIERSFKGKVTFRVEEGKSIFSIKIKKV